MALAEEPDVKEAFGQVFDAAIRVIGSRAQAVRWLGTPVRALNYATPVSVLGTPAGKEAVLAVLERAEYGVF